MTEKRTTLRLHVSSNLSLEGEGSELVYKIHGWRKQPKTGKFENYDLELVTCRNSVKMLAIAIASMQERDSARIAREVERLRNEIAPLVKS